MNILIAIEKCETMQRALIFFNTFKKCNVNVTKPEINDIFRE